MDFEKFRRTAELSDVTVLVGKIEFKLHKFPLFTKSDYFKRAITSASAPYVIRLEDNFPGGAEVFERLADYFYSMPIDIDRKNIVSLRSAACFLECETLNALLDKYLDEMILEARAKEDLSIPLALLARCIGEYRSWAKKTQVVDKCLGCATEILTIRAGLPLNRPDQEAIIYLPLEWIIELIHLCQTENKWSIIPLVKYYITTHVLEQNQLQQTAILSSERNQEEHQSAFTPVTKKEYMPSTTVDEKRTIIEEIVDALGHALEQYPVFWLNLVYEKAVELNCKNESIILSCLIHAILNSASLNDCMENIPVDTTVKLLECICKHKEDHIKDTHLLEKLSSLIDSYVQQLRQRGTLTNEQFINLSTFIPKEKRNFYDSLLLTLDEYLKNEKSTNVSDIEREELLSQIDFSRVNEETIAACQNDKLIQQQLITDAALTLCIKLRRELEETENRLYEVESELTKVRAMSFPTSSKYRLRNVDSSFRYPSRSRVTYSSTYDSPKSSSSSIYSKYSETDLDYILPSRYLSSTSTSRYNSYYNYRY